MGFPVGIRMFSNAFQKKFRHQLNLKSLLTNGGAQTPASAAAAPARIDARTDAAAGANGDRLTRLLETFHPSGGPGQVLQAPDKA